MNLYQVIIYNKANPSETDVVNVMANNKEESKRKALRNLNGWVVLASKQID